MTIKLEDVEKAIQELQSGKRVASVRHGESQVQYAATSINELLQLRNRIKADQKGSHRQVIFSTSKGLK